MTSKSGKQKATTFRPPTQILSTNLSNSTFGLLPANGSKGKSPAVSSRNVNVQPDLDLISGFAFLSFGSLDQLETHIEHNEANYAAVSVNVGQKRKAECFAKPQGNNSELRGAPKKNKAANAKKKPLTKISGSSTSGLASKPKESYAPSKDRPASVGTLSVDRECSQSERFGGGSETLEHSPNAELEISLLCSETVDLGDEEEILQQEVLRMPVKSVADSDRGDAGDGCAATSSIRDNDNVGVVEEGTKPKKKKKKRKSEHCDQTSQTKFRIKKKKKAASQIQDLANSSNVKVDKLEHDVPPVTTCQEVVKGGKVDGKAQSKTLLLSRPKFERVNCARTSIYKGSIKSNNFKNRSSVLGSSSGINNTAIDLIQARNVDKSSVDGCTPNSSDREIDVGDETTSISVLSDISDHSSDTELYDCHGCFLLNSKIDRVEKEDVHEGDEIVDVDVETVGKEARKNFLVVSGVEAGHFSYHPGATKEGTIDTSIQAYPNEIDIFLKCAKMQDGHMIKIINPDDSDELHSHFTQKSGRDPDTVKATRSATERKRRHRLGDLFRDMKLEVFTDLLESDLYFSKQAILSKAIETLEELEKEHCDLTGAKTQLIKQNKKLKEKRNVLMFGKASVDVDNAKVEAILKHLNINVNDVECSDENTPQGKEDANVKQGAASEPNAVIEPSAKGRPRANKSFLHPWLLKPLVKSKDDASKSTTYVPGKSSPQAPSETPKVLQADTSPPQSSPALKTSNVSCGVQTLADDSASLKSSALVTPSLSQILLLGNNEPKSALLNKSTDQDVFKPSLAESSPKVIHTVTSSAQAAPAAKVSKSAPPNKSTCQEVPKPSLLQVPTKLMPKVTSSLQAARISNVPTGGQAQERKTDSSNYAESGSSACSSKVQFSMSDSGTPKSASINQSSGQERPKPSLVKILPKPTIVQLNPTQEKAIIESLGQVKQPSSNKIICNLSRLSTQPNTSKPSRICIIRSNQLMKSLESKNVVRLKITNDALKSLDPGSTSTVTCPATATPVSSINTPPGVFPVGVSAQKPDMPTSTTQMPQKHCEKTLVVSPVPLTASTSSPQLVIGGQRLSVLASTSHSETLPSASQTSVDVTMRALASLNQLQASKPAPPLTEAVTNPLVPKKSPLTGYLIDLKNVVMKVGSVGSKVPSSTPLQTFPAIAITKPFIAPTSSQVSVMPSSQMSLEKCGVSAVCSTVITTPVISVPTSTSLNSSFTMSAANHPVVSTGINSDLGTSVPPLVTPCLDPFNLVPRELATPNPAISSEPSDVSSSLETESDVSKQGDKLENIDSLSLASVDVFKPETASSSTVLTQEMLKIPGINQNPELSSMLLNPPDLPLPDVFPELAEIDHLTTETVELTDPSCIIKENKDESDVCASSSFSSSGTQADPPSYSLRSSSADASKRTSPLRVTIKDFKKGIKSN